MHHLKTAGRYLSLMAAMVWLLPVQAMAESPITVATRDVQLGRGGELQGQVVNAVGHALPESVVVIRQQGHEVAQVQTDAEGRFVAQNLPGGLYEISTQHTTGAYRLWTPGTAPPAAMDHVRVVSAPTVYRAQSPEPSGSGLIGYPTPIVVGVGLGIAAAIAVPLIVLNQDDDSAS